MRRWRRDDEQARAVALLDPVADAVEVYRDVVYRRFPWDVTQALSLALFRTYAVPSIGRLLAQTGESVDRAQKRYEDTGLLLDAVLEHGPSSPAGRTALRRINAMHSAYDISADELRYVLSTFVVMPVRWTDAYGWRPFTEAEKTACTAYNRELGRRMGLRDLPETWAGFERLLDDYEREHFAPDPDAQQVARATLRLLAELPPHHLLPAALVRTVALALMDDHLLAALALPRPAPGVRLAVRAALRLRARVVRLLPPRTEPLPFRRQRSVRGYRSGYDLAQLGTFPGGCPVPRGGAPRD